ncbi:alpha/beta fold hydrolase [Methylocystis parvus]|uniref:Alpha/beta fold hydrolase n=1 Tax=Methylocystis parvus TaxID=134 RepID=A0A6B8M2U1_9HYPH|nr:alpha/beta fold hydrolase [Methylocystis parvus]QGM96678.1 alpha/beta fold hydrolase [Methylocystis parvus]WBJ99456.1 alpha/beta fold hydrolase [Methylocystis parvus OBBP]
MWDIWTRSLWAWPLATMDLWRRTLELPLGQPQKEGPQWTTPARLALEFGLLRLWDFSTGDAETPALIVSPYALHDAQIADLAPGHSLIDALLRGGCRRLFLVEWVSAGAATQFYGIDHLLAELNVAVDELEGRPDLIGLCQGGWLSLAYAVRFRDKIRRLVLAGAPVDIAAARSVLAEPVERTSDFAIDRLVDMGGGVIRGDDMAPLWPREKSEATRLADALQSSCDAPASQDAIDAFQRWDRRRLDLPAPYFRDVLEHLFRENLLAGGKFPALGKRIDPRTFSCPLFLLAGAEDVIAPPAQVFAVQNLVRGAVEAARAPCGHLALFMGRRTIENEWPRIAQWLLRKEEAVDAP